MIVIEIDVDEHGPVFDGRAEELTDAFLAEWVDETARATKNEVSIRLDAVLRNPTPYYETRIRTENVSQFEANVNDGPNTFIYGPWLEGTGSRNATTRFKGYHTFRIIGQKMNDGRAEAIGERVLARFIGRMQ